jgi:hypothetical protein
MMLGLLFSVPVWGDEPAGDAPASGAAAASARAWPWEVPVSGDFTIGPRAGYSSGSQIDGATIGFDTRFNLAHGFFGLGVSSIFLAEGVCYALGVEGAGTLGPLYLGGTFNLHWFPGLNFGQAMSLGLRAGALVPTPLDGVWLDVGYRVHFGVADLENRIFHVFGAAVLFRVPG